MPQLVLCSNPPEIQKRLRSLLDLAGFPYTETTPSQKKISENLPQMWIGLEPQLPNTSKAGISYYRLPAPEQAAWFSVADQAEFLVHIDRFYHPHLGQIFYFESHRHSDTAATGLALALATAFSKRQQKQGVVVNWKTDYSLPQDQVRGLFLPPNLPTQPAKNIFSAAETHFLAHRLPTALPRDPVSGWSLLTGGNTLPATTWQKLAPVLQRAFPYLFLINCPYRKFFPPQASNRIPTTFFIDEDKRRFCRTSPPLATNSSGLPTPAAAPSPPRRLQKQLYYLLERGIHPGIGLSSRHERQLCRFAIFPPTADLHTSHPVTQHFYPSSDRKRNYCHVQSH